MSRAQRSLAGVARVAAAVAAASLLTFAALQSARAFVPQADRALAAVAQANQTSGRTQAIQLDLVMRIGGADAIARGELVSHPSGLARLELAGAGGRVDRYLLSGPELLAAKNGEPLANPQPMLQPIFLLQPSSQETLRVALESFGVDGRLIGLAPCGDLDCYVFGDPALAAPARPRLATPDAEGDAAGGNSLELEPRRTPGHTDDRATGHPVARLWVDTETLQVQRIDRESGVSLVLGPLARFERLMVPAWLEVHEPGQPVIHFDVERATRVNATPQAFNPSWLYAPIEPGEATPPGGMPASPATAPRR